MLHNNPFVPISDDDAETIYQLRNALLHSFGLYSKGKTKTHDYRFFLSLGEKESHLIRRNPQNSDEYLISISALHDKFETAVERYRTELEADSELQNNFNNMFQNYGAVGVQPGSVPKW